MPTCSSELLTFPAKVFWLGRLQHGEGQDQEQAASGGADREGGDHRRPHPHSSGPAAEETLSGCQQTGWLIPAAVLHSTLPLPVSSSIYLWSCIPALILYYFLSSENTLNVQRLQMLQSCTATLWDGLGHGSKGGEVLKGLLIFLMCRSM